VQSLLGEGAEGVGAAVASDVGAGVSAVGAGVGKGGCVGADVGSGSGSGSGAVVGAGVTAAGVGAGVGTVPMSPVASLKSAQLRKASGYESCELPVTNSHCSVQGSSCVQVNPAGR